MKRLYLIILTVCSCVLLQAQNQNIREMVINGVQRSVRQTENHEWKEAFATCRALDEAIRAHESSTHKAAPELYYLVAKERLRMYQRMSKAQQCNEYLARMDALAQTANNQELYDDFLITKAEYYQSIGKSEASARCYKTMVQMRLKGKEKDNKGTEEVYKQMQQKAKDMANVGLTKAVDRMYAAWQDSIGAVKAASDLKALQDDYASAQQVLDDKDSTIGWQRAWIVILGIIAIALACGLVFVALLFMKSTLQVKKLKSSLSMANDNNERKSQFINRLGEQIAPSLDAIEAGNAKVHIAALRGFLEHTRTYMELESSREEPYELNEYDICALCEKIRDKAVEAYSIEMPVKTNVPRISFKTNAEAMESIMMYIIGSLVKNADTEHIGIDFKKGGAKSGKLIITGFGTSIDEEDRENIFKPFSKIVNLAEGDGLDLPTSSMMAYRLNGTLHLDDEFHKGARFVLELKTTR